MRTVVLKSEMINRILAEWNPIGVGYELAIDEYRDYIPVILQFCHDKKKTDKLFTKISWLTKWD